jgi:hypothetical protein
MIGKKEGIFTRDEMKTTWKLVSEKLPIPAVLRPIANLVVPGMLDGLDDKVGDRIPEPWQTHCETLVTMAVKAAEDKIITQQEVEEVASYVAMVVDEKIDIPLIPDDTEAIIFLETFRLLAALLYGVFKDKVTDDTKILN